MAENIENNGCSQRAVSYTHLDVYKRQLEASEADAGESYAYSDYIEGSVQSLSELAVGEERCV